MRILGVDPGLGRTGVAVVDGRVGNLSLIAADLLETTIGGPDGDRLSQLYRQVAAVIARHQPDVAAVESLYFSTNRSTAVQVAQARGVILCALAEASVDITEYAPNQVKESVAGFGSAHKPQVARMVCRLLQLEHIVGGDDVADACAVAICHHHRGGMGAARAIGGTPVPPHLARAVLAAQTRLQGRPG